MKWILFPVYLAMFLDMMTSTIILPLQAPLIFDKNGILPLDVSPEERAVIFSGLLMAYPVALAFGAPVMGKLAEAFGRKNVLLMTLLGTLAGNLINGLAMTVRSIHLLFIGKIINGFTGANLAISQAIISDSSREETQAQKFGYLFACMTLGRLLGPLAGGELANPERVEWFDYAMPFWFSSILILFNILFLEFMFKKDRRQASFKLGLGGYFKLHQKIHIEFYNRVQKAFQLTDLKVMLIVNFLFRTAYLLVIQFFPVFLFQRFEFNTALIGDFLSYWVFWIILTEVFLIQPLTQKFSSRALLNLSLGSLGIIALAFLIFNQLVFFLVMAPFFGVFFGLAQVLLLEKLLAAYDEEKKAEVLGINQSLRAISGIVSPLLLAFSMWLFPGGPFAISGAMLLVSLLLYLGTYRQGVS
jgi:MFS transporter, DHA1 family, tetracycline resistance protein